MEGPFISDIEGIRGAHPVEAINARDPSVDDFEHWQTLALGQIRMITIAPERRNSMNFIRSGSTNGIRMSIGHTNASDEVLAEAKDAGAKNATHLGNGGPEGKPRDTLNPFWWLNAEHEIVPMFIGDGFHITRSVIRNIKGMKTTANMILVSDASPICHMPPGKYKIFGHQMEVEIQPTGNNGASGVVSPGQRMLGGSHATMLECANWLTGEHLFAPDEIRMIAYDNPLRRLGITDIRRAELPKPPKMAWDGKQFTTVEILNT